MAISWYAFSNENKIGASSADFISGRPEVDPYNALSKNCFGHPGTGVPTMIKNKNRETSVVSRKFIGFNYLAPAI